MKIGITADCSSGLEYFLHEHSVKITRTTINFKDEVFIDGVDITADEFYEKLSKTDIVPTTSAPTMEEILKPVEYYKANGYTDVIHFPISFTLSSYGENLRRTVPELIDGINYHVFNSRAATIVQGYVAYYAEVLANKSYDLDVIFKECEKIRNNTKAYFIVDDLKYLVKNGRLSTTAGFIGNLAKIKPILTFSEDGRIVPFEKVRTHVKAVNRMVEIIKEESKSAKNVIYIVLHTGRLDAAKEVAKSFEATQKNAARVEVSTITPTVGAHIGCGVIGMARIILDDLIEKI
jgi:DegV family protein with EDD domain